MRDREMQKYHDGRYKSVDIVYLCGEIDNPDKERAFVPIDKVLEIIDKEAKLQKDLNDYRAEFMDSTPPDALCAVNRVRMAVIGLKDGECK